LIDEEKVVENETPDAPTTETAEPEHQETTAKDPYEGKSADDLKTMLRESQKQIGKQSTEIGEVRKLREEMESLKQQFTVRPQFDAGMTYNPPPPPPQEEDFDFGNVPQSVDRRIEKKLGMLTQQFQNAQAQRDATEAQAAFERTKKQVYKDNPELFKGIEGTVEQQLFNAWKMRAADKTMLANPDIWESAAILVHKSRGTLADVFARPKTVKAPQMETPQSRRMADEGDDITWSREDRRFMEDNGLTEKEAAEALGAARQMKREGALKWT
jgi:hypothetical protein